MVDGIPEVLDARRGLLILEAAAEVDPVVIGRWIHGGFNALEAGVWLSAAIYLAARAVRLAPRDRLVALGAAAAFLAFSASDVWEISSGAWFRPPALLVLKASCLAILIPAFIYYRRRRRRRGRRAG